MTLPLDDRLLIGVQTIHRRSEPATGLWLPEIDELVLHLAHYGGWPVAAVASQVVRKLRSERQT